MGALRKHRDRMEELGDLAIGVAVTEHRQGKCRLGDEDIARDKFERRAGRISDVLIVAGRNNPQTIRLDRDLRRAEHMAGGMERDADAAEVDAFAVADRLRGAGKVLAVAQAHQIERFLRRQHRAMARAGMIGMGVSDQRPLDRPCRIDVEGTELAAHAGRRRHQDVFRSHGES